jgi:hypothetical protein
MRRAGGAYPAVLERFTTIELPTGPGGSPSELTVPLRGEAASAAASKRLASSPYGSVYALARRWTASAPTAFDAVEAIRDRLRSDYFYSESPPHDRYPLRAFLLADRFGYCQQFSGAMALMLRMVGIPSRVAAGFSPGQGDGDRFVVRDYDAHSWVEVYFNGIGWVPFDPTPGVAPAGSQEIGIPAPPQLSGEEGTADASAPGARQPSRQPAGGGSSGTGKLWWLLPLGVCAALLAGALPLVARRRRWASLAAPALAEAQLRELEAALRRLGPPIGDGTTLRELERRLTSRGKRNAAAYASKLRAARFGAGDPMPPSLRERRRLRRELRSGAGPWAWLRSLLVIPPGGPALPVP